MTELHFSIIVPVFNRPDEVDELLQTLTTQTNSEFEVIIVEDGSSLPSNLICDKYSTHLNLHYFNKPNEGPGPTRNFGIQKAKGNYFIFFDSDCLIPEDYIKIVKNALTTRYLDLYGGPDKGHPSFTPVQKAISYTMTSLLTTGGIRGKSESTAKFHPRSFNMGMSRQAYEKTGGFARLRFGEDLDLSMRAEELGLSTGLIKDAYVYHKRRTDFRKFFRQVYNSGIARINLYKRHPSTLKLVHAFPAAFVVYTLASIVLYFFGYFIFVDLLILYLLMIFAGSFISFRNFEVSFLSMISALVQHFAYGLGFLKGIWRRVILKKDEFTAYETNFYK